MGGGLDTVGAVLELFLMQQKWPAMSASAFPLLLPPSSLLPSFPFVGMSAIICPIYHVLEVLCDQAHGCAGDPWGVVT